MNRKKGTRISRQKRLARVRAKLSGTAKRPRLNVYRSLTSMYVQLVDDQKGKTLASVHSKKIDTKGDAGERKGKVAVAYLLGKEIGAKAEELKIKSVVFDRAGCKYHGRVSAVADGARDAGLKF